MHESYPAKSPKRKRRPRERRPQSLLEFIRGLGGIRPDQPEAGDLRAMDAHLVRSAPGRFKLVRPAKPRRSREGMMIDAVRELAEEAGYLPEGCGINDLLEAIDNELRGIAICYSADDRDTMAEEQLARQPQAPDPAPEPRAPGRPPLYGAAMVAAPAFRIPSGDLARLADHAASAGEALGTFAHRCLMAGLERLTGEEGF